MDTWAVATSWGLRIVLWSHCSVNSRAGACAGGLSRAPCSLCQVSWDKDSLPPGWEESEDILTVEDTPSGARGQAGPERPATAVDDPENTGPERRACEEKEVPA